MKIKILSAKRSPIGKFLGFFHECDAVEVCSQVIKGLNQDLSDVDISIFGNVLSTGLGQGISRNISVSSGVPITVPAYTVSMVCGSGMQAIINSCNEIKLGKDKVLTGGFEFMSNVPFSTNSYLRLGKKFGDFKMVDLIINDGLTDAFNNIHMGQTAEKIATELCISRADQDNYALLSQKRCCESLINNYFDDEIVNIKICDFKGNEKCLAKDEFPRFDTTLDALSSLKPAFIKDGTGTVTAGNSSGINDGASFLMLASDEYCKEHNIKSNIEILDWVSVGINPEKMGLGPFFAIKKLLDQNRLNFKEIDVFEINEAFAAQILGCFKLFEQEYKVSREYLLSHVNLHGSGIGLGHPLGCSGARIVTTLYHHMIKNPCKYGIASLCVGGGMGLAILLKKDD